MDAFALKLIAITAMFIDHSGYLLFHDNIVMRIIGRLTIPIICFFIAEGYRKTSNLRNYTARLLIFAVVSMIPFYLVVRVSPANVLFNLILGLIALYLTDKLPYEWQRVAVVTVFAYFAYRLPIDGVYIIVPLIYLMHKFRDDFRKMCVAAALFIFTVSFIPVIYGYFSHKSYLVYNLYSWIRPFSLFSLLFLSRYNGRRGHDLRYLFYIFYPAHLLFIYFLSIVI